MSSKKREKGWFQDGSMHHYFGEYVMFTIHHLHGEQIKHWYLSCSALSIDKHLLNVIEIENAKRVAIDVLESHIRKISSDVAKASG